MKCIKPISVYDKKTGATLLVGCYKCLMCRIARVKDWQLRLLHHSYGYSTTNMFFGTFTYSDDSIKDVSKRDCQLFFKRLRKKYPDKNISYYLGAEYGEKNGRPHYHAIIFGYYPSDLVYYKTTSKGYKLYLSSELADIWNLGFVVVGHVSPTTIEYTISYIIGKDSRRDDREQEFSLMSKGIGKGYLYKNFDKLIKDKAVIRNGKKYGLPRYYKSKMDFTEEEKGFFIDKNRYVQFKERYVQDAYDVMVASNVQEELTVSQRRSMARKGHI